MFSNFYFLPFFFNFPYGCLKLFLGMYLIPGWQFLWKQMFATDLLPVTLICCLQDLKNKLAKLAPFGVSLKSALRSYSSSSSVLMLGAEKMRCRVGLGRCRRGLCTCGDWNDVARFSRSFLVPDQPSSLCGDTIMLLFVLLLSERVYIYYIPYLVSDTGYLL